MSEVLIYTLSCPKTKLIRYVGKTGGELRKRLSVHLVINNKTKKSVWINELKKEGLKPIIEEVATVSLKEGGIEEKFYISYFRFLGFSLLNMNSGGQGVSHTDETRRKISIALTGVKRSEEQKALLSEYNKLGIIGRKGHFHKESSKILISEKLKLYKRPKETIDKIVANNKSRSKPVIQMTKKGEFLKEWESISMAAQAFDLCKGHIIKCCKKKKKHNTAGGFKWEYKTKIN